MKIDSSKKVSIVMLTYNHSKFIAQAIESVLSQETNFSYEILIGEDESQDGTRGICQKYADRYPDKIKLFLRKRAEVRLIFGKPNGSYNWFETLNAATGKYIAYLEGDDYWVTKDKLQKQIDFLESNPEYSGSCHKSIVLDEDTQVFKDYRSEIKSILNVKDVVSIDAPFHPSSFVFKREFVFPLPSWLINMSSGDMALFQIVAHHGPIKGFSDVVSCYRKHAGGITSSKYDNRLKFIFLNRVMMLTFYNEYTKGAYEADIKKMLNYYMSFVYANSSLLGMKGYLTIGKLLLVDIIRKILKR